MAQVLLEHLEKSFRDRHGQAIHAIRDLSLAISDGEFLVFTGPSGSGKTTMLRLLAGLETLDSGRIFVGDTLINELPAARRDVAMVFQNPALYPHMTVRANLAFGLRIRRVARAEVARRVEDAAAMLGLAPCLDRLPMEISGGERQRVALGRALVRRPTLFLFDEPLASLDPQTRVKLRGEIATLHRQLRTTTIYVTHDHSEAMALGDRIAVLHQGLLEQVGRPLEVYNRPANLFVAAFIGYPRMNLLPGEFVQNGKDLLFRGENSFSLSFGENLTPLRQLASPKQVVLGIRPENVSLLPEAPTEPAVLPQGQVALVETAGADAHVHVSTAAGEIIARTESSRILMPGLKVALRFDAARAHVFDPESGKSLLGS